MRLALTVADARTGESNDVVVRAEAGDSVAALTAALDQLLPDGAAPRRTPGLWRAGLRLDERGTLGDAGVRDGDVLALGGPGGTLPEDAAVAGVVEVRVVGGPDAGLVTRLGLGDAVLGTGAGAAVRLGDPAVVRRHALLSVTPDGTTVTDLGGGATVDGASVTGPTPLLPGQLLGVGDDLLDLRVPEPPDAALTPETDGGLAYNRPPRILPAAPAVTVELPAEPQPPEKRSLPVLAAVLPLALGVTMATVGRNPLYLLFAVMSPVLLVGNHVTERRGGRRSYRQRRREYDVAHAAAMQRLRSVADAEREARRADAPDPAEVLTTATGPRRRLWERRRTDDDALLMRVGLADLPARLTVKTKSAFDDDPDPVVLPSVPVTVPLREVGVVGVAGPRAETRSLGRWLVAQTAVLSSPRDVAVVLLVAGNPRAEEDWGWVRWLPHARPGAPADLAAADCLALVGTDPDTIAARVAELVALVAARSRAAADVRGRLEVSAAPAVVVVLDGARGLRALPGVPQVLQDGPAVGVYAVCLDTDERYLPEECQAVVTTAGSRSAVRRARGERIGDVRTDAVTPAWAERVARALAAVRDVSREDGDAQLPSALRLLDVLGLEPPTADGVLAGWTLGGRSTTAVLGAAAEGTFAVDLRRDGPHALVAGTTGAGKSELLQTLIASLAVANRPDALTFVLVDYKGGSAFADCARLPHTVGMVTDLDGHLVERALTSLTAELKRREAALGAAGVKDLEDYQAAGEPGGALPRLVLVIDEFASLVEELPDFVRGLVGIAQRGRSLGVHLVLATQRPSGVVSPEIRANTNLRVALRVTDPAESTDVIDAPDAARIARSTPGRGYARTGHASLTAFQAARVGGRRPAAATGPTGVEVLAVDWAAVGRPLPAVRRTEVEEEETDLRALVDAVGKATAALGVPPSASPWLPPLPELLPLEEVVAPPAAAPGELPPVHYGLADVPDRQARAPAALDLEHGGHLLVAGAARSGRSTVLRTIAGAVASAYDPADVHLHALDCGNGALLPLAALPHCGAVVTRTQVERADRLLQRLAAEVARRADALAAAGFADVAEQRRASPAPERLPYLVLLLDRWEGFLGAFDDVDAGRLTDLVHRLLREGPGAGLRVVVTGDRSALMGKISAAVEDKLVLRLADRSDYALAGLNPRTLPDAVPPGRAFRGDTGVEVQLALLGGDPAGQAQAAVLAALAERRRADPPPPPGLRPFRVDVLPARVTLDEARELLDAPPPSAHWALVGVGGDELTAYGVDLARVGPGFVIGGPARSGRSTALLAAAASFLHAGTEVVVLAPRPSPLRELVGAPGVVAVSTAADPRPEELAELLNGVTGPLALLVDDAELLHPSDAQPLLQQVLRDGRDVGHVLVLAGTTEDLVGAFRGFTVDARKSRTGMILSPESHAQGDLLGVRLPRSAVFSGPPGRALLVQGGSAVLVQVPLVTAAELQI